MADSAMTGRANMGNKSMVRPSEETSRETKMNRLIARVLTAFTRHISWQWTEVCWRYQSKLKNLRSWRNGWRGSWGQDVADCSLNMLPPHSLGFQCPIANVPVWWTSKAATAPLIQETGSITFFVTERRCHSFGNGPSGAALRRQSRTPKMEILGLKEMMFERTQLLTESL